MHSGSSNLKQNYSWLHFEEIIEVGLEQNLLLFFLWQTKPTLKWSKSKKWTRVRDALTANQI